MRAVRCLDALDVAHQGLGKETSGQVRMTVGNANTVAAVLVLAVAPTLPHAMGTTCALRPSDSIGDQHG